MTISDFTKIVAKELGIDPTLIASNSHLINDLGVDSLSLVNIVVEVEEQFGYELHNLDFEHIQTIQNAFDLLTEKTRMA